MSGKREVATKTTPKVKKTSKPSGGDKKSRKKSIHESYSIYVYKVLKQVHNKTGILKKSMIIMNSFINYIFDKLVIEASKLVRMNTKQALSTRKIQSAVK